MKKVVTKYCLIVIVFLGTFVLLIKDSFSQPAPGCPNVNAGPDVNLACGGCTNLTATPFHVGTTTTYNVTSVTYAPPYPFNAGTPIFVGQDDIWSDIIWLPFSFCFFGNEYTQIVVGANGLVSFNTGYANQFCPWSYSASVPSASLPLNSIFGAYHDIDPSVCGNIRYAILGTAPCRTFVVNFDQVCHYSCTSLRTTQQIVLYETTNVIEVYIQNKPTCGSWNSGNAVVGIQNATGTVGFVPPGYNTGPWTVSNMGFRFTPNGAPAYTLEWLEGPNVIATNQQTINVCPGASTMYTARITYNTCNVASSVVVTDDVWVNVTGIPTGANSNSPLCVGQTLNLTSQGGYVSYQWSGPNGFTSNQQNPTITNVTAANAGVYTVTVNDGTGSCSSTLTVVINEYPVPTISGAGAICSGQSTTLTAGGGDNYSWNTGENTPSINVSPISTTTYTVTVTNVGGCSATTTHSLVVNALPNIGYSAQPSTSICQGTSLTLNGTGAQSYVWSGGVTDGVSFIPPASGQYTVTGTDANGCSSSTSVNITVNSPPIVSASATPGTTVCAGQSITLQGSGAQSYSWSVGVIDGVAFIPSASGTYTVTGTDANGCSSTATISITVNPIPTIGINAIPDDNLCEGESVTLNGTGAQSYSWSSGVTNGVAFVPSASGTYTVTGTDANGCSSTSSVTVTVNPIPIVGITAIPGTIICANELLTLQGTGAQSYIWNSGVTDGLPFIPPSSGTYTVTGTDANGCSSTASINIIVNPTPNVSASAIPGTDICAGQSITLQGVGAQSYSWSGGVTNGVPFNPPTSNQYTVTGTDANGCSQTSSITITVHPLPNPSFSTNPACLGQSVDFTNYSYINSGTINSYYWNLGDGNTATDVNPSHYYDSSGIYIVSLLAVSDQNCQNSYTDTVFVSNGPDIEIEATPLCFLQLQVTGINNSSANVSYWIWDYGDFTQDTIQSTIHTYQNSGTYTVNLTAIDNWGCIASAQTSITTKGGKTLDQLQIPNVITPNGDNLNDELILDPEFEECSPYVLYIYNRWGVKVYETSNNGVPFAGISNTGTSIVPGTYFIVITSNDLKYHGSLTVIFSN